MPYASKEKQEDYIARRYARLVNDPEAAARKRAAERDRYHRNKRDPEWLAKRRRQENEARARRDPKRLRQIGRDSKLKQLYGITRAEYNVMLDFQGGGCAICGCDNGKHRMAVDHDHRSGKIRGLLCHSCNLGIGQFGEDTERLRKAANYLASFLRSPALGAV